MSEGPSPYAPPAALAPHAVPEGLPISLSVWLLIVVGVLNAAAAVWVVPAFEQMYLEVGIRLLWVTELVLTVYKLPWVVVLAGLPVVIGVLLQDRRPRALGWLAVGWVVGLVAVDVWALTKPLTLLISPL